jgi:hypothetical protein
VLVACQARDLDIGGGTKVLRFRRSATGCAVLALVATLAGLVQPVAAAPRSVTPIVITAPASAPANGTAAVKVVIAPITSTVSRTAVLAGSWDSINWTPISRWKVRGSGVRSFTLNTGSTLGRLVLRVTVTGAGLKKRTKTTAMRITNPYRPTAPDDATIPEAGIVVSGALFGNHPVEGTPEGAGTVRLWDTATAWNQIEPSRGVFAWDALDRAVSRAESAGQEVLLVLGGTPKWAAVGPAPGSEFAGVGSSMPMTDPVFFDEYVRAVVQRYGGRISAYQIWNEGNIKEFWRGTPEFLADLTARAYNIIKPLQPGATVVAASTGSRWVKGFTEFFPDYLTALGKLNWPIDAYSVHLYPTAAGTTKDRSFLLGMMKTALRIANAPVKPIWETEINYGITNPGSGQTARLIPDVEIPGYVARTYLDSLRFGIARTYWYAWTKEYRLLGIQMFNGYTATRAFVAMRDWVVGARFSGCSSTGAVVLCNFDRGGVPFSITYTDDASPGTLQVPAGFTQGTPFEGTPAPVSGTIAVGGNPILLS